LFLIQKIIWFSKRQKKHDRKKEQSFNKTLPSLLLFHAARNNVSATFNIFECECEAEVTEAIAGMRWAMGGDGRRAMGDGRWAMSDERWAMSDERWA